MFKGAALTGPFIQCASFLNVQRNKRILIFVLVVLPIQQSFVVLIHLKCI